jgi:hypothetical protein
MTNSRKPKDQSKSTKEWEGIFTSGHNKPPSETETESTKPGNGNTATSKDVRIDVERLLIGLSKHYEKTKNPGMSELMNHLWNHWVTQSPEIKEELLEFGLQFITLTKPPSTEPRQETPLSTLTEHFDFDLEALLRRQVENVPKVMEQVKRAKDEEWTIHGFGELNGKTINKKVVMTMVGAHHHLLLNAYLSMTAEQKSAGRDYYLQFVKLTKPLSQSSPHPHSPELYVGDIDE